MKPVKDEDAKSILLNILEHYDKFCRERHLRYSLAGGTLIGALRHKGFIPWDDDIDVFMPRQDYDRFLTEYKKSSTPYHLVTLGKKSEWHDSYSRIADMTTRVYWGDWTPGHGLWLAILPIDNFPGEEKWLEVHKKIAFWKNLKRLKYSPWSHDVSLMRNIAKKTAQLFIRPISDYYMACKISSLIQSYNHINTEELGNNSTFMLCKNNIPHHFDRHCFDGFVDVEFEGKSYKAMSGYDSYLTKIFGDWHQLPPEDQRVTHGYKAYHFD